MRVDAQEQYASGSLYSIKHDRIYVLPVGEDGDMADFQSGYMLSDAPNFDIQATLLCLEERGNYIKFLYLDKLVWIFNLDVNSTLRLVT